MQYFPPEPQPQNIGFQAIASDSQPNAWYQNADFRNSPAPQNQRSARNKKKRSPFLGHPPPQLATLQMQVDRLEEMIKSALGIETPLQGNPQAQTCLPAKSNLLWGPPQQQVAYSSPPLHHSY